MTTSLLFEWPLRPKKYLCGGRVSPNNGSVLQRAKCQHAMRNDPHRFYPEAKFFGNDAFYGGNSVVPARENVWETSLICCLEQMQDVRRRSSNLGNQHLAVEGALSSEDRGC
jgi:hypothetical protein